jgi:hypothetical protein
MSRKNSAQSADFQLVVPVDWHRSSQLAFFHKVMTATNPHQRESFPLKESHHFPTTDSWQFLHAERL